MTGYDPTSYWTRRGEHYEKRFKHSPAFAAQELALRHMLRRDIPAPESILEVGCGFGRIGEILMKEFPQASYTGVDISPVQIKRARRNLPASAELVTSSIRDFRVDRKFDLVVAVEVLMHVPPNEIGATVEHLRTYGPLLSVDWSKPVGRPTSKHNFLHDYVARGLTPLVLVGEQTIYYTAGGAKS